MWVPLLLVVELTVPTLAAVSQSTDWLVHPFTQHTAVVREGDVLRLGNGLIERTFFAKAGAFCTVDFRHLPAAFSYLRGLSAEANVSFGAAGASHLFDVGGCVGQPDGHYEFFNSDAWQANLTANTSSFQMVNYSTAPPDELYEWTAGRYGSPTDLAWPPAGLHLTVNFAAPAGAPAALANVVVSVHYEVYDGLPVLRKWVTVEHLAGSASPPVVVETLDYELLRVPNWAPSRMTVLGKNADNYPNDQQIPALQGTGSSAKSTLWYLDPNYDQCCDKQLHVVFTLCDHTGSKGPMLVESYAFSIAPSGARTAFHCPPLSTKPLASPSPQGQPQYPLDLASRPRPRPRPHPHPRPMRSHLSQGRLRRLDEVRRADGARCEAGGRRETCAPPRPTCKPSPTVAAPTLSQAQVRGWRRARLSPRLTCA